MLGDGVDLWVLGDQVSDALPVHNGAVGHSFLRVSSVARH